MTQSLTCVSREVNNAHLKKKLYYGSIQVYPSAFSRQFQNVFQKFNIHKWHNVQILIMHFKPSFVDIKSNIFHQQFILCNIFPCLKYKGFWMLVINMTVLFGCVQNNCHTACFILCLQQQLYCHRHTKIAIKSTMSSNPFKRTVIIKLNRKVE